MRFKTEGDRPAKKKRLDLLLKDCRRLLDSEELRRDYAMTCARDVTRT